MKKIQCQLIAWVRKPPASRPIEPPPEATKAKTPSALARSAGAGNSVTMIAMITEEATAPPMPWTKRAEISSPWLSATPQRAEAAVNSARPAMKTLRRPTRSPSRPASSRKLPKAIRWR
jgi:hypothetical protein